MRLVIWFLLIVLCCFLHILDGLPVHKGIKQLNPYEEIDGMLSIRDVQEKKQKRHAEQTGDDECEEHIDRRGERNETLGKRNEKPRCWNTNNFRSHIDNFRSNMNDFMTNLLNNYRNHVTSKEKGAYQWKPPKDAPEDYDAMNYGMNRYG